MIASCWLNRRSFLCEMSISFWPSLLSLNFGGIIRNKLIVWKSLYLGSPTDFCLIKRAHLTSSSGGTSPRRWGMDTERKNVENLGNYCLALTGTKKVWDMNLNFFEGLLLLQKPGTVKRLPDSWRSFQIWECIWFLSFTLVNTSSNRTKFFSSRRKTHCKKAKICLNPLYKPLRASLKWFRGLSCLFSPELQPQNFLQLWFLARFRIFHILVIASNARKPHQFPRHISWGIKDYPDRKNKLRKTRAVWIVIQRLSFFFFWRGEDLLHPF